MSMHRLRTLLGLISVLLAGCSRPGSGGSGGADEASSFATASGPSSSTAASGASSTSGVSDPGTTELGPCADEGAAPGGGFDLGPPPPSCDSFVQDCDPGFKCVPDRGAATRRCVPIVADPLADGAACTLSFEDVCGPLSWCRARTEQEGTCVALCGGSWDAPTCADGLACTIDDERIVAYCDTPCDPFDASACGSWTCQPTPQGFGCLPGGHNGAGGWCVQHDSCVAGLACAELEESQGCCHARCCAPMCDASHPCVDGSCVPLVPAVVGAPDFGYCAGPG